MGLSFFVYLGFVVGAAGLVSVLAPLRFLGIRHRGVGLLLLLNGLLVTGIALTRPADEVTVASPGTRFDEFAPVYQFDEAHMIPVHATPQRAFRAVMDVTAAEIPLYRFLVWVRRGGASGPESILNPPDNVSLITVALRTTFLKLAEVPDRELVMGTVVLAPPGVRLALGSDPGSFKTLSQPGYAKATIGFQVEPAANGWCLVRTRTRVYATDPASRTLFARYWRVIRPGSELLRQMWLRAIKVRAEAPAR